MATMPAASPSGQPAGQPAASLDWFGSPAGEALLGSEAESVLSQLGDHRGLPWLWLAPLAEPEDAPPRPDGRGLRLWASTDGWCGDARCALPLPLAGESVGTVVLQHVLAPGDAGRELLAECTRVLVPGGRLALFALNPLAPYRWRWRGSGLKASEPLVWRRRLREAGLQPEPLSQGVGPGWRQAATSRVQAGAGLRAAYLIRAEKRAFPMTPVRQRRPVPVTGPVPAR